MIGSSEEIIGRIVHHRGSRRGSVAKPVLHCAGRERSFAQKKESRGLLLCFSGLYPPPGTLPNCQTYCRGVTVPLQVEIVAVGLTRTTASANEQKYRTPVWFEETGVAMN